MHVALSPKVDGEKGLPEEGPEVIFGTPTACKNNHSTRQCLCMQVDLVTPHIFNNFILNNSPFSLFLLAGGWLICDRFDAFLSVL